jgi:hypothetical protein
MTTEGRPLLGKVNDSDKQRGILPETAGHSGGDGEGGCGEIVKKHKWKIVGVVAVVIVATILGIVLGTKGDDPKPPGPKPPPTPEPIDSGYNLYYLNKSNVVPTKNMVTGILSFNDTRIDNKKFLEKSKKIQDSGGIILDAKEDIPMGVVNNEYIKDVKFEFSQTDYKVSRVLFTDNKKSRFSIPGDVVKYGPDTEFKNNNQMSTNMAGFNYTLDPFGFEIKSTRVENVINVNT